MLKLNSEFWILVKNTEFSTQYGIGLEAVVLTFLNVCVCVCVCQPIFLLFISSCDIYFTLLQTKTYYYFNVECRQIFVQCKSKYFLLLSSKKNYFVLFCFILYCIVLYCIVLFLLFCSVLLCSVLLCLALNLFYR